MIDTAWLGNLPFAVSPLSMTASTPSNTALATSVISARVGLKLSIMDSSIWVAQITKRPAMLARVTMYFCARVTFSGGISMPRSPRATMTPSASSRISSRFSSASIVSILATTFMSAPPSSMRRSLMYSRSSLLRTNEAATMSTSASMASCRSRRSRLVRMGRLSRMPSRLMLVHERSLASLSTLALTSELSTSVTSSRMSPSLMSTVVPGVTCTARSG
mmetsp:Transcript_23018/g.58049  ORF Transcript_23018/g.58049 Transcript_23018/m.58049 type:complete len:219 (-) Transcript_23018:405-1061(-)